MFSFVPEDTFVNIKKREKYSGVYLFVSNDKNYVREEALLFGRKLLDFTQKEITLNEKVFFTETNFIPVETVNAFIDFEAKCVVRAKAKLIVMHDVELLKNNTADKLLKTIEDHHKDSLIILTTTDLANVLNTIRSRCMIFKKYVEVENTFVQLRNKYLSFIEKTEKAEFKDLDSIIREMSNLGALNIIQAMFVNLDYTEGLKIAEEALNIHSASAKDDQVCKFLVYSYFCYYNNIKPRR